MNTNNENYKHVDLYLQDNDYDAKTLKAVEDMKDIDYVRLLKPDRQLMARFMEAMSLLDDSEDIDEETKDKQKLILTYKTVVNLSGMYTKVLDVADATLVNGIVKLVLAGAFSSLVQIGKVKVTDLMHDHLGESAKFQLQTPRKFRAEFSSAHNLKSDDFENWHPDMKQRFQCALKSHIEMCQHIYRTDKLLVRDGGIYNEAITEERLDDAGYRYNDRESKRVGYRFDKAKQIIMATMNTEIVQKAKLFAEKYRETNNNTFTDENITMFFSEAIRDVDADTDGVDGANDDVDGFDDMIGNRAVRLEWDFITKRVAESATKNLTR